MDEAKLEQYYVGGRVYIYRMGANFRYINLAPEPSVEMFVGSNTCLNAIPTNSEILVRGSSSQF